jgi:hypothetical protein
LFYWNILCFHTGTKTPCYILTVDLLIFFLYDAIYIYIYIYIYRHTHTHTFMSSFFVFCKIFTRICFSRFSVFISEKYFFKNIFLYLIFIKYFTGKLVGDKYSTINLQT